MADILVHTARFDVGDVAVLPDLLDQVEGRIHRFLGDGAYDGDPTYRHAQAI